MTQIPILKVIRWFSGIVGVVALLMFMATQAGRLVSSASDEAVVGGFLLYLLFFVIIIAAILFVLNKVIRSVKSRNNPESHTGGRN